jgi:hypothetical protein
MVCWRTGSEGRISAVKREWGCREPGWTVGGFSNVAGHRIFADNLVKVAGLIGKGSGHVNSDQPQPGGRFVKAAISGRSS